MTAEETKILIVDDSALHRRVVGDALRAAGYQVDVAQDGEEALRLVAARQPDAIVLDVMMPGLTGYQVCRALREEEATARIPVVMLTTKGGIEAKVAGFEAGADDYLVKPVNTTELLVRLKVLLRRAQGARYAVTRTGQLLAVFSLRGGVGVTSLAVNLAVTLTGLWNKDVPLLDMALTMGQVALLFNVKAKTGICDLAERELDEMDNDLVESALYHHPTGVRILSAPMHPEDAESVSDAHVNTLLPILKDGYPYLVADLPSDLQAITLTVLDHADYILLVLAPELASVRAAAAALNVFASLGYSNEKIKLILNWTFKRHGLPQKNIETALGQTLDVVIPFAPDLFVSAINQGIPLVASHPDSGITTRIEDFAFRLTRPEQLPGEGESMTPMLARVRRRLGV